MWRHEAEQDVDDKQTEAAAPAPPAPAVAPGSMAWASAVGNAAVARLATSQTVAREGAPPADAAEEITFGHGEKVGQGPQDHEEEADEGEEEELPQE